MPKGGIGPLRFYNSFPNIFSIILRLKKETGGNTEKIGMNFASIGWLGLWCGDMVGRVVGVSQMMKLAWPVIKEFSFPLKTTDILQTLMYYRKYPIYSMPSMLIGALSSSLILPLVSHFYGSESAGQYALVQMVFLLPMNLVVTSSLSE